MSLIITVSLTTNNTMRDPSDAPQDDTIHQKDQPRLATSASAPPVSTQVKNYELLWPHMPVCTAHDNEVLSNADVLYFLLSAMHTHTYFDRSMYTTATVPEIDMAIIDAPVSAGSSIRDKIADRSTPEIEKDELDGLRNNEMIFFGGKLLLHTLTHEVVQQTEDNEEAKEDEGVVVVAEDPNELWVCGFVSWNPKDARDWEGDTILDFNDHIQDTDFLYGSPLWLNETIAKATQYAWHQAIAPGAKRPEDL